MTTIKKITIVTSLGALAVAAYAVQSTMQLTENGRSVSTRLTQVNGEWYVPVKDVATYFGYSVAKNNGVETLTKNGNPLDPTATSGETATGAPQQFADGSTTIPSPAVSTSLASSSVANITTAPGYAGTAVTTSTSGLFPSTNSAQAAAQLNAGVGQNTAVGDLSYKVQSIQDEGTKYKFMFDQRGTTVHPRWKTDKLELIQVSVTNNGSKPITPYIPTVSDVSIFDSMKIGYPASYVDVRQSPDAFTADGTGDSDYDIAPLMGTTNLMLGPGGTMQYAIVASIPKDRSINSILFNIPSTSAMSDSSASNYSSGAQLTVHP